MAGEMPSDEKNPSKIQDASSSVLNRQRVVIRIEGCLDQAWAEWFEGFDIAHTRSGDTTIRGRVSDQAALYGLIAKLRDLGVKLRSVRFAPVVAKKPGKRAKPRAKAKSSGSTESEQKA